MTQLCAGAERWSAAAGSTYTAPRGKNQICSYEVFYLKLHVSVSKLTAGQIKF